MQKPQLIIKLQVNFADCHLHGASWSMCSSEFAMGFDHVSSGFVCPKCHPNISHLIFPMNIPESLDSQSINPSLTPKLVMFKWFSPDFCCEQIQIFDG